PDPPDEGVPAGRLPRAELGEGRPPPLPGRGERRLLPGGPAPGRVLPSPDLRRARPDAGRTDGRAAVEPGADDRPEARTFGSALNEGARNERRPSEIHRS